MLIFRFNCSVRAVLERHEDMISTGQRPSYLTNYKVGFSKEGKLHALDLEVYTNWGSSPILSTDLMHALMDNVDNVYKYPNFRGRAKICKTNLPPGVPMRAAGTASGMVIQETILSHVAVTLGIPEEKIRELNFYKPTDVTHTYVSLKGWTLDRCWEICLQRSDFFTRKLAVEDFNKKNRWKKRGLSIAPVKYPIGMTKSVAESSALVHIYTDGAVLISHGGIEMGQGLFTKMLQIASRTLRIPVEKIHCAETSTNTVANNAVTHGSIGTDYNGPAVKDACETLLHRLEPYMMENPKGSWENWITAAHADRVCLSATGHYKVPDDYYTLNPGLGQLMAATYFCFGAAVSEVEVDCLTGDHRLIRTDIVMDVGDSINPAIDIGQIEGAFIQGYGMYVLEDYRYSPTGELLTIGPGGYKVPLCNNVPSIFNVSLLHSAPNPRAICSSKAVGEPPFLLACSVLMAIKSAISSARADEGLTGYFPMFIPAVPDRIRLACQDKFTRKISKHGNGRNQQAFIRP
ncbi:putative xanthine dehydrogenase/oxidase [Apostichopus japonicus]|uniref:Putative xanthine dehydrogenase/oxidase n=1 Tax=Stichopus japonicus TaxID=307972 RepID=A0A2G8LJE7_STIJA|nr:putative xanthine dehydrogenase/oxidase [Apostichopus japonicus]